MLQISEYQQTINMTTCECFPLISYIFPSQKEFFYIYLFLFILSIKATKVAHDKGN